ncbi:MAG TPA: hypothetical protein VF247_08565 [Candidatus Krumholzibacteria bacterium]
MADTLLSGVLAALVGGLLAVAGALAASWFQARITLRTRMNQVIAERKVSANADAYRYLKMIESHLAGHGEAEALTLLVAREDWLTANRLFLPPAFADAWMSLRTTLRWLTDETSKGDSETLRRLRLQALRFVKDATRVIQRDMDFEEPDLKAPA